METLVEIMRKALADTFQMYLKAHNFHWNVEGPNFSEYHSFFSNLYTELHDAVDPIAEHIRSLDAYAPGSLTRFLELAEVQDEMTIPAPIEMMKKLYDDNQIVINTLNMALKLAETFDKQGLMDFLAGRIDVHHKHGWMLRSYTK